MPASEKKDLEPKYHKRKKLLRHEGNCMSVIYKEMFFMDAGKGEGLWVLHTISAFLSASPTLYSSDPVTSISREWVWDSTLIFTTNKVTNSKTRGRSVLGTRHFFLSSRGRTNWEQQQQQ
jgi:hypothetical protein